jgi:Flp pilus assembly protein TadG
MTTASLHRFLNDRKGSATIEFIVVFLGFIAIIFFVLEVTIYQFFAATLEKAAQAGARAAVVSTPVAAGVPLTNGKTADGIYGQPCNSASNPCTSFQTISCTGGACAATPFTRILDHMRRFNSKIEAGHVTLSYQYTGLGFAGGPSVPMVTVTVSGVPFETGIVGLLLTNSGVLAALPAQTASMTGEDLAQ